MNHLLWWGPDRHRKCSFNFVLGDSEDLHKLTQRSSSRRSLVACPWMIACPPLVVCHETSSCSKICCCVLQGQRGQDYSSGQRLTNFWEDSQQPRHQKSEPLQASQAEQRRRAIISLGSSCLECFGFQMTFTTQLKEEWSHCVAVKQLLKQTLNSSFLLLLPELFSPPLVIHWGEGIHVMAAASTHSPWLM